MRLPLLILTAGLILIAIRWLGSEVQSVAGSSPSPIEQALQREGSEALLQLNDIEELEAPAVGRQAVVNKDSVPDELAAEFELRHRSEGPKEMFASWSELRSKLTVGVHEVGLRRFNDGRGVLHRGQETKPNEELAAYWMDDQNRLVRVEIPEVGNHRLYRLHREALWLESQLNSYRWDADEMQELSKTVFEPSGEGADVRRAYLRALRPRNNPKSNTFEGRFGAELEPLAPDSEDDHRVRATHMAYMATRTRALDALRSASEE